MGGAGRDCQSYIRLQDQTNVERLREGNLESERRGMAVAEKGGLFKRTAVGEEGRDLEGFLRSRVVGAWSDGGSRGLEEKARR